jgi:hypothetical protein
VASGASAEEPAVVVEEPVAEEPVAEHEWTSSN